MAVEKRIGRIRFERAAALIDRGVDRREVVLEHAHRLGVQVSAPRLERPFEIRHGAVELRIDERNGADRIRRVRAGRR